MTSPPYSSMNTMSAPSGPRTLRRSLSMVNVQRTQRYTVFW
jgi:hypothetical protein